MSLPTLSAEEREANRLKAIQSRKDRADALDKVRNGTVSLAEVLDSPESPLRRVYVRKVLEAIPGVGPVKAARVMGEVSIAPNRRIQGLRHLQRQALAERFGA